MNDELENRLEEMYDYLESWYEKNHVDGNLMDCYWDLQTAIRYFLSEKRRHFNLERDYRV